MGIRNYRIEMRIDINHADRVQAMTDLVITVARELRATAVLLGDGPKPTVRVVSAGFFEKEEVVDITEAE
jgi:hypothetical protein